MDRLNDIMSNSHLPARQSASEKRISPDYRAQQNRSPLTRRPPAEQGRRQAQPQPQPQELDASDPTIQPYNYQPRLARRVRNQASYGQYGLPDEGQGQREEPITRTDYPTYAPQQAQRPASQASGAAYSLRSQPHQDQPQLHPLQPRPTNNYYVSQHDIRETADDYVAPLHADAVDEESWENGLVYGDFEQGTGDALLYEEEEIEELEEEQSSYQQYQQHQQRQQPHQTAQPQSPMSLPPTGPVHYAAQNRTPETLDHPLRGGQRGQHPSGHPLTQPQQGPQSQQSPLSSQSLQLPRNLHDSRLASALARQRAARKQTYQRVTQPLDPDMTSRAMSPAQPTTQPPLERERPLRPRTTRILQSPQLPTTGSQQLSAQPKHQPSRALPTQNIAEEIETGPTNNEPKLTARTGASTIPAGVGAYTNPKKVCPKCHGAGYLRANVAFGHPNFGKPIACECKEAERKEKRRQQLRTMSNLDAFRERNFEAFQIGAPVIDAYNASIDFAEDPGGWLVLVGPNGCGKTHLAAAIANQRLDEGAVVLFEAVPDLLDHLRAAFAPTATEVYDQLFSKMREAELLVLDDLGAQQSSPWANEKLFQLLNYRYNMEMPTVITANPKALNGMDERIRSRLSDSLLVQYINMDRARDFRPMKGKRPQ